MLMPSPSPLFNRLLRLSSSSLHSPKVCILSSFFYSSVTTNPFLHSFSTLTSHLQPTQNPATHETQTHVPISPNSHLGIRKPVISGSCDYHFAENSSLQDILKQHGHLSPESTRPFWRVSSLRPSDFLEILLGFDPNVEDLRVVGFLWSLFRWASEQCRDFRHLPRSFEIMITMLIRVRMLREAESLLVDFGGDGWMFSEIVRGYALDELVGESMELYDKARERGIVLAYSCYKALLELLVRMGKSDLGVRVYEDMLEGGVEKCCFQDGSLEFVVGALSKNGKTFEAVNVLRRVRGFGVEPSRVALDAVVDGYCRKMDYEDVLVFLKEWSHIPDAYVCNKIVSSLCQKVGSDEGCLFVQKLEDIGFQLDPVTFGILISHSCQERKLKSALIYLSECLFRGINLELHAYSAVISGLFKEGMHSCVKDICEEMVETGKVLGLSTFRVLLAGYCKYRKFEEVKQVLAEMVKCGIISLSPSEDAFSKAFKVLGIQHFGVKVKRDNDSGHAKAEFFDSLGNGLYLETDVDEFHMTLDGILDNGIIPDFSSLILEECDKGDIETALRVKDEALQWGKKLSLSASSKLVQGLCVSPSHVNRSIKFLDEIPEQVEHLGHENLNLLIQYLCKNGERIRARFLLDMLLQRRMLIQSDTYTALLLELCKDKQTDGVRACLEMAQSSSTWLPEFEDIKELIYFLCKSGLIKEVLQLFDDMAKRKCENSNLISAICCEFVKELCSRGFSDVGGEFVKEFLLKGYAVEDAVYTSLIEGLIKKRRFTEALGMADQLLEKNMFPSASIYQLIVPLLFKFNRTEMALTLKQNLLNSQSNHISLVYNTLVNELCRIGKMKEATFQLHEMLVDSVLPDRNTLNFLIQGFLHTKNLKNTLEILSFMLKNNLDLTISGYRSLIRQFCVCGRVPSILKLQQLMVVKGESESLVLYNILIFYLFQSGNSLLVESLLKKMGEAHLFPDQCTYNFIIYGFCKSGNISRSVGLLDTMIAKAMEPSNRSLRIVIRYLCSNGEVNKALELSKVMQCKGRKHGAVVLHTLTEGLLICGGISMAEIFLDRMEENKMIPENINWDLLIKKFCVHGSVKTAVHLLNSMLKKGNFPSEISYNFIIKGLSNSKTLDQALDFRAEMMHKALNPSLDSCNTLICGLCDNGRVDEARQILGEMLHFGQVPTKNMYNYVIDKCYAQNNLNKASELLQEMQIAGYSPNFESYWSLISNLSGSNKKGEDKSKENDSKGFLSRLLSAKSLHC